MRLDRLIAPTSIAVVGASERSALGRWIIESLRTLGFNGAIYPVNPKYERILDLAAYPSLEALPESPDVVAFCIPSNGIIPGLEAAARIGAGAAVVYDGGFAERGTDGLDAQIRMSAICVDAGIALCGPNCMGVLNPLARSSTFKQTVRTADGLAGNIGLISQSGSICGSLLADLRRFGFSVVISAGNEAVVDTADYISYLADDPGTRVIATFTEAIRSPARYVAALDKASTAGKPVVVLKVGRSDRTRHAITSHTGGLAGEARVVSEVLRAHGAIEVDDLDEFTEILAATQARRWPTSRRINVLTTSGGQAELLLDVATSQGIDLAPLAVATRTRIEREVGPVTGDGNPLDAWGNGNAAQNMPPSLRALDENADTDVIVFCSSDSMDGQPLGRAGRELDYARIIADAAVMSTKPHYLLTMRPGVLHTGQIDFLRGVGVAAVSGARQGLGALVKLADWSQPRPGPLAETCEVRISSVGPRRLINEYDAKTLLRRAGISAPREILCRAAVEVAAAAVDIGYPVVLKVAAEAIPHKSEHGLVAVGLADGGALAAALAQMERTVAGLAVPIEGWLVQQMVSGGVEMFAGVSRDPQFGLMLSVGFGGIAIEVVKDFAVRPLPLRAGDAQSMIASLRGAPLLQTYRGRPARDVDALITCVEALSRFAFANRDLIEEIDVNPLIVRDAGEGCVAVDALIVCQPGEPT